MGAWWYVVVASPIVLGSLVAGLYEVLVEARDRRRRR